MGQGCLHGESCGVKQKVEESDAEGLTGDELTKSALFDSNLGAVRRLVKQQYRGRSQAVLFVLRGFDIHLGGDFGEHNPDAIEALLDAVNGFEAGFLDVLDVLLGFGETACEVAVAFFGEVVVVALGGFSEFGRGVLIDADVLFAAGANRSPDERSSDGKADEDNDDPLEDGGGDAG